MRSPILLVLFLGGAGAAMTVSYLFLWASMPNEGEARRDWGRILAVLLLGLSLIIAIGIIATGAWRVHLPVIPIPHGKKLTEPRVDAGTGPRAPLPARIRTVNTNGQAASLGLQVGDIIVKYAGVPVTNGKQLADLVMTMAGNSDPVAIEFERNEKRYVIQTHYGELGAAVEGGGFLIGPPKTHNDTTPVPEETIK